MRKLLASASLAAMLSTPLTSPAVAGPLRAPVVRNAPAWSVHARPAARHGRRNAVADQHVIVMIQENRTVDNLFQGFSGADTQSWGLNTQGSRVPLQPVSLRRSYDPSHSHDAFVRDYDGGAMDGWDKEPVAYGYVPQSETQPYWSLAQQFALADHVLQPNEGPSFPAHQYLIAGQSGYPLAFYENPPMAAGTCASSNRTARRVDMTSMYPGVEGKPSAPCADYPTIFDELDGAGVSWKYYVPNKSGIWTAPLAISHIYNSQDAKRIVMPEVGVLSDIQNHQLPQVSYVIPRAVFSDHPWPGSQGNGPDWVGSVANAIGQDPFYWGNTTLIVVWDDWGGWYDHYTPVHSTTNNPNEYGFRVPMIVVSAFVKPQQVDHTVRSSAAILGFIETTFGLNSLQTLDAKTDDLSVMFDYGQLPNPYTAVNTHGFTPSFLRRLRPDNTPVDS